MDHDKTFIEKIGSWTKSFFEALVPEIKAQKSILLAGLLFFVFISLLSFVAPPRNYPIQTYLEIPSGSSLSSVSRDLAESEYIKSEQIFKFFVVLFGRQKGIKAGEYFFEHKISLVEIAWRMVHGDTRVAPVSVTFFEGATVEEMAEVLTDRLFEFDKDYFLELARSKEGYLFPDTYHFKKKSNPEEIVEILEKTFIEKTDPLLPLFEESGRSIDEIVIMASIIEKEAAHNLEEKKTISGILWKRISIDMPLQVDATLKYITGKGSAQLTNEDLQTDYPYNTYTNKGLPPGPISNPGVMALKAAAEPIETSYLYYLHDNSGNVYYAKNHGGHLQNRRNYLGK